MTDLNNNFESIIESHDRLRVIEAALVLAAMNIDHFVERDQDIWHLKVATEDLKSAREQLTLYQNENRRPSQPSTPYTIIDNGWLGVLAYLTVIWSVPALQSYTSLNLLEVGRLEGNALGNWDWWRPITALTLHGSLSHILSNSFFGVVFGLFVGRHLGSGLGWLLVLTSGAIANILNSIIQPEHFKAIGASTATFACLGMVPAFGWRKGYFRGRGAARGFAPIFGAIALLALTGGFDQPNVDIFGHVLGFSVGITMGLLVAKLNLERISLPDQQRAGFFAIFLICTAWLGAWGNS